jgi:hypothetical protein
LILLPLIWEDINYKKVSVRDQFLNRGLLGFVWVRKLKIKNGELKIGGVGYDM